MRFWLFAILLPLAAGAAAFWAWPFRPVVKVVSVQRGRAVDAVTGTVCVMAARDLTLRAEVPGRVTQVCLSPGMGGVKVGIADSVALLDTSEIEGQITLLTAQARGAAEREKMGSTYDLELQNIRREMSDLERFSANDSAAQGRLEKLQRDAQRLKILAEQEGINRREDSASFAAKLALLKAEQGRMNFRSPIEGLVAEAFVTPGDWVSVGAPILRILSNEKLIQASLDEADVRGVEPGQPVLVYLSARPGEVLRGRVGALSPMADPQTRRRLLYVTLDVADDSTLVPGMTGQMSLTRAERPESLLVPRRALLGDKVLTVQGGQVKPQVVEVGFRGLHYAEIVAGLDEGQSIIVDNLHMYRDGQRVNAVASTRL